MPDGTAGRFLGFAVVIAAVAAVSVLVRALQLDEAPSQRVFWLTLIAGEGGALAVTASALSLALIHRGGPRVRGLAGGIATGLAFIPFTLACFAFKIRILDGRIEGDLADGIVSGEIIFSLIGAMGMFTPTGLRYLAPWPLLAVTLVAGLLFWRWPEPRQSLRSLPEIS